MSEKLPDTKKESKNETKEQKLHKEKKEHKGLSDEHWENIIAVLVVLLLVSGAGWWVYGRLHPTAPVDAVVRVDIPLGLSPTMSAADNGIINGSTSVIVVQFSDFECSYCGKFARDDFPTIKKDLIDTGKVKFVYKQFPLSSHQQAELAAEASVCANDQGKFWEYHDMLYAHQDKLASEDLERYATDLKLDAVKFHSCLSTRLRSGDVQQDSTLGRKLGVTGTPTFFFNGRPVVGALSADEFAVEVGKESAQ